MEAVAILGAVWGDINPWWLVVALAVLLIGVTKSGFGAGVGLMIVPMTAIAMGQTSYGEKAALGLLLPLLITGDLVAVWQYRKLFSTSILKKLGAATLAGVVLGGLLLWLIDNQSERLAAALIRIEIGFECVLLVGLHYYRLWRGDPSRLLPEPMRSWLTGCFAAISSTLAHAAGPIIALYLLPLKLDRQLFVGTCAIYFFALNTAKLPAYYLSGQFDHARIGFTLQFLPLVLVGALVGKAINKRISDVLFTKIVYVVTFLLGWYMLADGGWALMRYWSGGGS